MDFFIPQKKERKKEKIANRNMSKIYFSYIFINEAHFS